MALSAVPGFLFAPFAAPLAHADSVGPIDFESYTLGGINGQDGWTALGSAGSGCAVYDEGVASSLSTTGFGNQSFRISNAVTSGCFGDQAFAKPAADAAGEVDSTAASFSVGTLQHHFEAQFDIASANPQAQQPGLSISVSPDRGDGSRMSYLRFDDNTDGIGVTFYDVQGTFNPANFVPTFLGTLDRTVPHTIKFSMDFYDGPSNDVVRIYIDGNLVHTGTSWENYYRYDSESSAEQSPRIVKTLLFRAGGTAAAGTSGKGYLFDNITMSTGDIPPVNQEQACNSLVLTSGSKTQTAGYTETNPTGPVNAFDTSKYSDGVYIPAVPTQTVIPPWIDPATDPNFATSSAVWVSSTSTWPGGSGNTEGLPGNDQWRLFEDEFTLPAGATVSSADLWYTADNSAAVYADGASTPFSTTYGVNPDDVYGAVPGSLPLYFSNVYHSTLAPHTGENILNFVVRNWGGNFNPNPTGVLYKAVVNYCMPTPPPSSVKVTIVKYLDGQLATANSANNTSFPMTATWSAQNIGSGSGGFSLGPNGFNNPNPYEATTADMTPGANYSTQENVPTTCDAGNPYELVGYSSGATLEDAIANGSGQNQPSPTPPSFTGMQSDEYVIVWNATCEQASPIKVHIFKYLDGQLATAGTANGYQFPMTATWTAANLNGGVETSGNYVLGNNHGGAPDQYGADTSPMTPPADYTTSEITHDIDASSKVLSSDETCAAGDYQLEGYQSSLVSLNDALAQATSTSAPNFTGLTGDAWVVVRNITCPTTATLTVEKDTIGGDGTFTFTGSNGIGTFSITTASGTGSETFTNLPPGTYTVTEAPKKGWIELDNTCSQLELVAGENIVCVITNGNSKKLGGIRGVKYEDMDGDGTLKDGDHHRLAGWTVYLDLNNNGSLDSGEPTAVTDSHGVYHFLGLLPGTYHVREVQQPGWTQTFPWSGSYTVVVKAGKIEHGKNFGNFHLGSITGMKFYDQNGNGRKDSNENGLQGWTIKLKGPHGFSATAVTDANGNYSFTNLGPGTYVVNEVQQTGWVQSTHNNQVVKLRSGKTVTVNIGNKHPGDGEHHGKNGDDDNNDKDNNHDGNNNYGNNNWGNGWKNNQS